MTKLNSSSTSEPSDLLYLKKIISNASFQTKATQKLKMNNVSIVTRRNFITLLDEIRGAPRVGQNVIIIRPKSTSGHFLA